MDDLSTKSVLDIKDINDLSLIGKISGDSKLLIMVNDKAYRITADTLVGYAAGVLGNNADVNVSPVATLSMPSQEHDIVFIESGQEIPVNKRTPGVFYLEERSQRSIRSQINLPVSVKISKQMGLKRL